MKRLYEYLIMSLLLSLVFCMQVSALNTGFSTEELPKKEKDRIISNERILLIDHAPEEKPFDCFAVNMDGWIAIGQIIPHSDTKEICVYSPDGSFQYGFSIICDGTFGIEWDGDLINIYYCRGELLLSMDRQGQIVDAVHVPSSAENDAYCRRQLLQHSIMLGDTKYVARNDFSFFLKLFATAGSQLVVIPPSGEERIFYDVSKAYARRLRIRAICIIVFVVVVITIIICSAVKRK